MTKTYEQITDGEIVIIPDQGIDLACCSCGSVHQLRVVGGGGVRLRIKVMGRATGQVRRWMRRKGEGIFGKRRG